MFRGSVGGHCAFHYWWQADPVLGAASTPGTRAWPSPLWVVHWTTNGIARRSISPWSTSGPSSSSILVTWPASTWWWACGTRRTLHLVDDTNSNEPGCQAWYNEYVDEWRPPISPTESELILQHHPIIAICHEEPPTQSTLSIFSRELTL